MNQSLVELPMHSGLPSLCSSCRFSSVSEQPTECFEPFQKLKAGMVRRKSIFFLHSNILLTVPRWYFCCGSLLLGLVSVLLMFHLMYVLIVLVRFRLLR